MRIQPSELRPAILLFIFKMRYNVIRISIIIRHLKLPTTIFVDLKESRKSIIKIFKTFLLRNCL